MFHSINILYTPTYYLVLPNAYYKECSIKPAGFNLTQHLSNLFTWHFKAEFYY